MSSSTSTRTLAETSTMHIAVTGASGLVGTPLVSQLNASQHQVTRLVRRETHASGEAQWDPDGKRTDVASLEGVDAIVHLAGENIAGKRWTQAVKQRIRNSRVEATQKLCEDLAAMSQKPKTFVCASAIGYYGDGGDDILVESSPPGDSFLAHVVKDWEAATAPAADAGIRAVNLRIGVILSPDGGALKQMLTPFKLCAGGRVGSGKQYWSWVSLDDVVKAMQYALTNDALSGPANLTSPNPVTNAEFTKVLGKVLNRPTIMPMPSFAARLALGEMAEELLLTSSRVAPKRLLDEGFEFEYPDLEQCLRHLLGK